MLTCPSPFVIIRTVMTTPQTLINRIVKALEDKGESVNYILGFMTATMAGLAEIDRDQSISYLQRTLEQAQG